MKQIYEYRYNEQNILTPTDYHYVDDISQIPIKEEIIYEADENGMLTSIIKESIKEQVWFSEIRYEYAKLVDNEVIGLTEEEMKIALLIPLSEGEVIEDGKIITIPKPSDLYSWDFNYKKWYIDNSKIEAAKTLINSDAYNTIIEKYPLWKQINTIRNKDLNAETLTGYNSMITFIDEIRAWADYAILML